MDQLRSSSWDRAIHAAGTAHIFDERVRSLTRRLNLLTFAGLVLPVAVGAVVIGYGADLRGLSAIIIVAAALGATQLTVTLWSVVESWPGKRDQALRSLLTNQALTQEFESLGKRPPATLLLMRSQFALLEARDNAQRQQDEAQDVSPAERRKGLRAALLRFDRKCTKCQTVPPNMKPTECGVCGDF